MRQAPLDEGALSRSATRESFTLELLVRLEHRVRVDGNLNRQLLHGWQLITHRKPPEPQTLLDLLHELQVRSDATGLINVKFEHAIKLYHLCE